MPAGSATATAEGTDVERLDGDVDSHRGTVAAAPDAGDRRCRNSQRFLRLLFDSPGTLSVMRNRKQKTAAVLAGAVALASGAYALGSQADGSAEATGDRPVHFRGGPYGGPGGPAGVG